MRALYEFENEAGERREFPFRFGRAPGIGKTIQREGDTWRRIPSVPQSQVQESLHFESVSLPDNYVHHASAGGEFCPQTGKCRFQNRAQLERTLGEAKDKGDHLAYD